MTVVVPYPSDAVVVIDGYVPVPGPAGPPGPMVVIKGELADVADLPTDAAPNDGYLIDGDLWVWTGEQWLNVGAFEGPQGEQGVQGEKGDKGDTGATGADSTVPGPPGSHVYIEASAPPALAYLTPAVGFAHTPDTPDLYINGDHVITMRIRYQDYGLLDQSLGGQWIGAGRQWVIYQSSAGLMSWAASTDGAAAARSTTFGQTGPLFPMYTDVLFGVRVRPDEGNTRARVAALTSSDNGATWAEVGTPLNTDGSAYVPFNAPGALQVGARNSSLVFGGRIYWMECRTGLDPKAGTLVWRFDASEYPGTGTSYVDPRGRTWTLTAAGAITKPPAPRAGDAFLDTAADIGYTYDGTTWKANGSLGPVIGQLPTVATYAALPSPTTNTGRTFLVLDQRTTHVSDGTQWRLTYGDTGWRTISNLMIPPAAPTGSNGKLRIRRVLNTVWLSAKVSMPAGTATEFFDLPAGFQPEASNTNYQAFDAASGAAISLAFNSLTGTTRIAIEGIVPFKVRPFATPATDITVMFDTSFATANAWPTVLPGTPTYTIP